MLGALRKFKQLSGVIIDFSVHHEEMIETPHSRQDTRKGQGIDAEVYQLSRKAMEVVEGRGKDIHILCQGKVGKLLEVALICLNGII